MFDPLEKVLFKVVFFVHGIRTGPKPEQTGSVAGQWEEPSFGPFGIKKNFVNLQLLELPFSQYLLTLYDVMNRTLIALLLLAFFIDLLQCFVSQ